MNPQYEILAKCLLPTHMLEWFELTNVEVKPKEKTATQDTESDESPVNVIHLYLDENELRPDNREDLHPNGFTPAKTFHDFPIRGQEVLLHVRRRRWLDSDNHNVMSEFDFIQESTRCSKELADFFKEAFGDAHNFERSYKETISGFKIWEDADHAEDWVIIPKNMGTHLSIDETCLSTSEVYTILSNKEAHGRKGCLVAIVKGTKAKEVTSILKKIPEVVRLQVEEVTLDFSDSMHQIVSACFPKAMITLDRFHHQQFCLEALQEIRIGHRREVMTEVANARDDFRAMIKDLIKSGKPLVDAEGKPIRSNAAYHPERLKNNETKAELLMRSKYLLMVSPEKWTPSQRERAEILFELYPDIEMAYSLTHSLRMIFAQKCDKEAGRKSIRKWYAKVGEFDNKAFNDIAAAMYDREDEILNYFVNRSTNVSAESLNAKIKDFRAQLRGVIDKKFFIFRLVKIFG